MKKFLIALLAFGSISAFADCTYQVGTAEGYSLECHDKAIYNVSEWTSNPSDCTGKKFVTDLEEKGWHYDKNSKNTLKVLSITEGKGHFGLGYGVITGYILDNYKTPIHLKAAIVNPDGQKITESAKKSTFYKYSQRLLNGLESGDNTYRGYQRSLKRSLRSFGNCSL